jgi:hypothetical protein
MNTTEINQNHGSGNWIAFVFGAAFNLLGNVKLLFLLEYAEQAILGGIIVGPVLTADFRPGESVYLPAGWIALGYTNTMLPDTGTVQIQITITSYFKDGRHPGVDVSRDSWYFDVPKIGPK